MAKHNKPILTIFHCTNAFKQTDDMFEKCTIKPIVMACSSMTKDVHILKAFEAGADVVLVLVCDENICRYVEGSIRAKKRVEYVKNILNDIDMDSNRLQLFNTMASDKDKTKNIIQNIISKVSTIGESK